MEVVENEIGQAVLAGKAESRDLSFLPSSLISQCQSLIGSYHELHGYACLPDILWKSRLGPFIETHQEFRHLLKKASTSRSAKKSNEAFAQIAATILALEILASSFAGWTAIYPEAGSLARAILHRNARTQHLPLMDFYLYPPKYLSSAAIAALVPPAVRQPGDADLYSKAMPELAGEKQALNYVNARRRRESGLAPPLRRPSDIPKPAS
jgi:hypothetical protein